MKMVISGNWRWHQYEKASAEGLEGLGVEVIPFKFGEYLKGRFASIQEALPVPGPILLKINTDLLKTVESVRPDVLLVWRGTHILPATLKHIKKKHQLNSFHTIMTTLSVQQFKLAGIIASTGSGMCGL